MSIRLAIFVGTEWIDTDTQKERVSSNARAVGDTVPQRTPVIFELRSEVLTDWQVEKRCELWPEIPVSPSSIWVGSIVPKIISNIFPRFNIKLAIIMYKANQ